MIWAIQYVGLPLQDVKGALQRQQEELRLTTAQAEGRQRAAEEEAAVAADVDALTARLQERRAALERQRDGLAAEQESLAVGEGAAGGGSNVCWQHSEGNSRSYGSS